MDKFDIEFLKAAAARAAHTFCQAALGVILQNAGTVGVSQIDWVMVADVAALAAICSLLKSFAISMPEVGMLEAGE